MRKVLQKSAFKRLNFLIFSNFSIVKEGGGPDSLDTPLSLLNTPLRLFSFSRKIAVIVSNCLKTRIQLSTNTKGPDPRSVSRGRRELKFCTYEWVSTQIVPRMQKNYQIRTLLQSIFSSNNWELTTHRTKWFSKRREQCRRGSSTTTTMKKNQRQHHLEKNN